MSDYRVNYNKDGRARTKTCWYVCLCTCPNRDAFRAGAVEEISGDSAICRGYNGHVVTGSFSVWSPWDSLRKDLEKQEEAACEDCE
jgi:hypothetical protein